MVADCVIDKKSVLTAMRTADALHVSAYGFFSKRQPRSSGWVVRPSPLVDEYLRLREAPPWQLSPGDRERLDSIESVARDSIVAVPDLESARMCARFVVLSACQSGVVAVDAADDPTGLVPTLIARGTKTVVATLWLVDADATREFMVRFYECLQRSGWRHRPQALRTAALAIMQRHPHPYYWAPFVLVGGLHPRIGMGQVKSC